uniref:Uncharacterized protein n=1 Tax=Rhodymenia pseudopalmata TaxID=31502 RepID=A0A1C9C7Q4_RHOPU|nr:hypothetical protein Rhodyp_122 [Rhodymenia pseudopalmata]AOM64400.1 hypothetical protein Rhodyp_122 [Rhodymenia pseudopalmata]
MGNLLIYLLFGSSQIDSSMYPFNKKQTPKRHVSMLLENFILQASNLVTNLIFENMTSLTSLVNFLSKYKLCSSSYLSARSAATLLNNLMLQNLVYLYIKQPRDIYSSRYKILLIHQTGLQMKYIYTCRSADIRKLSSGKCIFISFLEIQDLLIPKLEKNLLILCKILLYIFINIIGSSIIFIIRIILSSLNSKL